MAKHLPVVTVVAAVTSVVVVVVVVTISLRKQRQKQTATCHRNAKNTRQNNDRTGVVSRVTQVPSAYETLIGDTPLVKLHRVSRLVGRSIYVKMESLNPGGTGKDRAAFSMILNAEAVGELPPPNGKIRRERIRNIEFGQQQQQQQQEKQQSQASNRKIIDNQHPSATSTTTPSSSSTTRNRAAVSSAILLELIQRAKRRSRTGGLVVEGTSGSTGISLATLCAARGHACIVVMPDDQAMEKRTILTTLGALVHVVPNAAISNPNHYVNVARRIATLANQEEEEEDDERESGNKQKEGYYKKVSAIFLNQFENEANFQVHYEMTGPELWEQSHGNIDAFVMSSGTGGTLAGVGRYLKEQNPSCRIVLVDPPGSSLYNKIRHGVAYAPQQRERSLKRHRYDTLAEGIGLDRITHNFALGIPYVDDAISVTDQEAVDMAHWLLATEGLWVGSSSAMNMVGAIRVARLMPPNSSIVTMICDGGQRHLTRFWNESFVTGWGLEWPCIDVGNEGDDDDDDGDESSTRIPLISQLGEASL